MSDDYPLSFFPRAAVLAFKAQNKYCFPFWYDFGIRSDIVKVQWPVYSPPMETAKAYGFAHLSLSVSNLQYIILIILTNPHTTQIVHGSEQPHNIPMCCIIRHDLKFGKGIVKVEMEVRGFHSQRWHIGYT